MNQHTDQTRIVSFTCIVYAYRYVRGFYINMCTVRDRIINNVHVDFIGGVLIAWYNVCVLSFQAKLQI